MNTSDIYVDRFLKQIKEAQKYNNESGLVDIINKIYEDGFVDGTNEAELKNNE